MLQMHVVYLIEGSPPRARDREAVDEKVVLHASVLKPVGGLSRLLHDEVGHVLRSSHSA